MRNGKGKKFEYFVLVRDPALNPQTGKPPRSPATI